MFTTSQLLNSPTQVFSTPAYAACRCSGSGGGGGGVSAALISSRPSIIESCSRKTPKYPAGINGRLAADRGHWTDQRCLPSGVSAICVRSASH